MNSRADKLNLYTCPIDCSVQSFRPPCLKGNRPKFDVCRTAMASY